MALFYNNLFAKMIFHDMAHSELLQGLNYW